MSIISKLGQLRVLLIAVITTTVTACASLMPLSYRISKTDIESKIATKMAAPKVFLSVFEARFAKPAIDFLPVEQRVRVAVPMQITERLSTRSTDALAVFSAIWEPTDDGKAVWLRDVRIESFKADGLKGASQLLQRALVVFVEPIVDQLVVYRLPDKEAAKFRIDKLTIDHESLVISTRPNQ